jgi:hypothetical protein
MTMRRAAASMSTGVDERHPGRTGTRDRAGARLRRELGSDHVYSLSVEDDLLDLVPDYAQGRDLFGGDLTFTELTRRFEGGAELVGVPGDRGCDGQPGVADPAAPLFLVSGDGQLRVVTAALRPTAGRGDTTIWLAGGARA